MTLRSFIAFLLVCMLCAASGLADQRAGRDTSHRPDVAANLYFVAFHEGLTLQNERAIEAAGARVDARFPEVRAVSVRISNARQVDALQRNPRVEYVEPVPMRYPMDLASDQLDPALNNGLYGLVTTRAVAVHDQRITGKEINVGVADTGLDISHPDIAPNFKEGIDTVGAGDNDPSWNNDPRETHGTHVAGTVLAANNRAGVLGVAYNANLYYARVLGPTGGTTADVIKGVRWLIETKGCKVVNLSLGGRAPSRTEEQFYNSMRQRGALVVAASGNDGSRQRLSFPGGYAANIAVGAVDRNNVLAAFSNQGPALDVVAPGVLVLSSVPANTGAEAAVTTNTTYSAFGLEFAGKTDGITRTLVNCGLGLAGQCPGTVSGNIALIQRGSISFAEKVTNAMDAGAAAAIIYNNVAGDFLGTLGSETTTDGRPWIPAVSVSDTAGAALVAQVGSAATVVNKVSSWDHFDGTSMATPHVTGVLALVWSVNPALTNNEVENFLFTTTTDLGPAGFDYGYGRGLINAEAAVGAAEAASR